MKHITFVLALLMGSFLLASPASAVTESTDTAVCVPSAASDETVIDHEAYDETIIDRPAHDQMIVDHEAYEETVIDHEAYEETIIDVVGQDAIPGTDAVYGPTEYKFIQHRWWNDDLVHWSTNPNWNAQNNEGSIGWLLTGITRPGALITPATTGVPAVDEESHVVEHDEVSHVVTHDEVSHVVHHEAVTHVVNHPEVSHVEHTDAVTCFIEVPWPLPVEDECGIGDASWVYSGDTSNFFSWDLTDAGELSAIAHDGYVFDDEWGVFYFGLAPEENTDGCPVSIPPGDVCPDIEGVQQETDCTPPVGDGPVTDTPIPVDEEPVAVIPVADVVAAPVAVVAPTAATLSANGLPNTGGPNVLLLVMGFALSAFGSGIVLSAIRRKLNQ